MLDLAPFGFTPTESHAYRALLDLGPSTGYAVARALSIARANAYQALDGLVAKGAAVLAGENAPRRYRAIQPRTVFARIVDSETRKLDALERQVLEQPRAGADPVTRVRGERALNDLVVRTLIRAEGVVRCLADTRRLTGWAPAIRARAAAGKPLELWSADGEVADLAVPARVAPGARVREMVGDDAVVLVADGVLLATMGPEADGIWSGSRIMVGVVQAALRDLTATSEELNQPDG
jgi:DNA-binding MarR family transcriptional regulator